MKKVGSALASAFLIFVGFAAQAQEMPFGFGIKAGYLNPALTGLKGATLGTKGGTVDVDLFNPSFNVGLFGEYAFHDYVGAGLETYYALTGARLSKSENTKEYMTIRIHQASIIPMLKVYPMGRNIDEMIFNIHLGPEVLIPFKASYKYNDKDAADDINKKDLSTINVAGFGGFGVEFPFGLLVELRGSYGFMSTFKKEKDNAFRKDVLKVKEDSNQNAWYANLALGYNFARLLEE
jgi:hypothetical protein